LFKNLILYRLPTGYSITAADLEEALDHRPLKACGSFEMQTRGFVHCGYEQRTLYARGQQYLFCLGVEQKLLPASIINQVAKDVPRACSSRATGLPPANAELRPGGRRTAPGPDAPRTTFARLDLPGGWLAVNTASNSRAELVETPRDALKCRFAYFSTPTGSMAAWLTVTRPAGSARRDLNSAIDGNGATIRYARHPLETAEVRNHLVSGKAPTRLGLTWNGRISFMLHQNLHVKRVQFLDVYKDDNAKGENPHEQFDIDFALMTGELRQLLTS
jgi:recombination associated protein RdgC